MDKEKLYNRIDDDENLSDSEKREIYYSELERMEEDENQ